MGSDIHRAEDDILRMPLPPSRRLNNWEMNVIDTWLAEKPNADLLALGASRSGATLPPAA